MRFSASACAHEWFIGVEPNKFARGQRVEVSLRKACRILPSGLSPLVPTLVMISPTFRANRSSISSSGVQRPISRYQKFSVLDFSFWFRLLTISLFVLRSHYARVGFNCKTQKPLFLLVAGVILRVAGRVSLPHLSEVLQPLLRQAA